MKRFAAVLIVLVAAALGGAGAAHAWTTFMHNSVAGTAYDDVVLDGSVAINGRPYPVDPRIVTALRNHESFFRAGVVGPDGLPDVTYGQRVVHIGQTGDWNRHVVVRAWAAQNDVAYSEVEREQILAFAYGYMAHAAGDMWAHTFVNGFAGGVFPGLSDILSDADNASIALRHLIGEVYIGDTAAGFDGNKDRQPVPLEVNEDGDPDISDTSTPRQDFAAPSRFIYETFVNPENPLPFGTCNDGEDDDDDGTDDDGCPGKPYTVGDPEPQRGPLIDFFLDLQAKLQIAEARFEFDSEHTDCFGPGCSSVTRNVRATTVRGNTSTSMNIDVCDGTCLVDPVDAAADVIDDLVEAYLEAWIEDIETGLEHWTEFGLATMRAMQDPQARRDAQNHICRNEGAETSALRANCEDGVGMLDVMLFKADPFIEDHLLSMLGLPDAVGVLAGALDTISEFLADVIPFNPVSAGIAELNEIAKNLVKDAVEETLGLNLDHLKSLITSPTYWLNVQNVTIELPILGPVGVNLFAAGTHELIDSSMGLPPNHHVFQELYIYGEPLPVAGTGLADNAVFNPETFKAFKNSVLQTKLLLLDSGQLNALLKDELVVAGVVKPSATIGTYSGSLSRTNVMWTQLYSAEVPSPDTWLRTIDGDHAWRVDGRPRFCDAGTGGDCTLTDPEVPPTPRPAENNAGDGTYPLWESCQNRTAFRSLFVDWENGTQNFPELGDPTSFDPSDAAAPVGEIGLSGNSFSAPNGTTYVGGTHAFALSASDATFTDALVTTGYRFYRSGTTPGVFAPIPNGGTFTIPAGSGDGLWTVELRSEDPCHTFADDGMPDGSVAKREVFLDTTPPTITITSPAPQNVVFDTDDLSSIQWTVTDEGSGVNASTVAATLDGAAAALGLVLDMFFLNPGRHPVVVSAADNLGNAGSLTRLFKVQATSESLVSNVERACTLGLIAKQQCSPLRTKAEHAKWEHAQGDHKVEHNVLGAWINQLEAQRGKKVDAATATRFIAYARDLIARAG